MPNPRLTTLETRYLELRRQLADIGYLSHGSVYRPPAGRRGARFTWSTKIDGKTVSLALSANQADWLDHAIAEHRKLKTLLIEMRQLSRKIMRLRFPDIERRTRLNVRILRLI